MYSYKGGLILYIRNVQAGTLVPIGPEPRRAPALLLPFGM